MGEAVFKRDASILLGLSGTLRPVWGVNIDHTVNISEEARDLLADKSYDKYYGGHQHRLGHYYRHLFQSYKYLNSRTELNDDEKYFYGKMLRAQLSTYEQALLFINSLSSLGRKWEYAADLDVVKKEEVNQWKLITKYHVIKNLPGTKMLDIKYSMFYPNVHYESSEIGL